MSDVIAITGGTGFLGSHLIPRILARSSNPEVIVISRKGNVPSHLEQLTSSGRLRGIAGDVTHEGLVFTSDDKKVLNRTTQFYHLYSSTDFSYANRDKTMKENVGGTNNCLDLAKTLPLLSNFVYTSTGYVANETHGKFIYEDALLRQSGFANPYEESKFLAERLVEESSLPWTIVRPTIFSGSSLDGSTGLDYRMGYGVLLGLLLSVIKHPKIGSLENYLSLRQQASPDTVLLDVNCQMSGYPQVSKNFMYIDDIAGQIDSILSSPDITRERFHVVTRNPLTASQVLDSMQKALRITGFRFDGEFSDDKSSTQEKSVTGLIQRRAHRLIDQVYAPYFLRYEPHWDTTNTDRCLDAKGYKRIDMTPQGFDVLNERYVNNELIPVLRKLKYLK